MLSNYASKFLTYSYKLLFPTAIGFTCYSSLLRSFPHFLAAWNYQTFHHFPPSDVYPPLCYLISLISNNLFLLRKRLTSFCCLPSSLNQFFFLYMLGFLHWDDSRVLHLFLPFFPSQDPSVFQQLLYMLLRFIFFFFFLFCQISYPACFKLSYQWIWILSWLLFLFLQLFARKHHFTVRFDIRRSTE